MNTKAFIRDLPISSLRQNPRGEGRDGIGPPGSNKSSPNSQVVEQNNNPKKKWRSEPFECPK
jgi:hypothetical protein